jgi:hypothetical protein
MALEELSCCHDEWLGIRFKLGTFIPELPVATGQRQNQREMARCHRAGLTAHSGVQPGFA